MRTTASATLNGYATPIVQALKAIVREPVFVSTKPHPHIPVGLGADILIARDRYIELKTDRTRGRLWLGFRQSLFVEPHTSSSDDTFAIVLHISTYQLMRGDGQTRFDEVVTYHWTPNDPNAKRTWPHLHIGSALIAPDARREPWSFHKTHLATGPMTAPAFVRMAVEEFGVQPVALDWETRILE